MKKRVNIIARQLIINSNTMKPHDDKGLVALDGILYGNIKEVDSSVDEQEIIDTLVKEFEALHPDFHAYSYEYVEQEMDE